MLHKKRPPRVLTIAGSDSGGGAGIQTDLKTFQALRCHGMSAVSVLTAQNTREVRSVFPVSPGFLRDQIDAVVDDIGVDSVKMGMLFSAPLIQAVARAVSQKKLPNVVVDPVMVAKGGSRLLQEDAIAALKEELLPLADLVTPNLPEASVLVGFEVANVSQMERAAEALLALCPRVVLKGGHLENTDLMRDLYVDRNGAKRWLEFPRIDGKNKHGTGCTFSAAIAAFVARAEAWVSAVQNAREFLQKTMVLSQSVEIGTGWGPLHPGWTLEK